MTTIQKQFLWALIIVLVAGGLYWWWSSSQQSPTDNMNATGSASTTNTPASNTPTGTGVSVTASVSTVTSAPTAAAVVYNGSSFSPSSITIAQGGTVTFTSTAGAMWVASDPHPQHTGYDGTSRSQHCAAGYSGAAPFDQCSGGTSFSFTFNKVGTWGYHDHMNASVHGSVTVVAQ